MLQMKFFVAVNKATLDDSDAEQDNLLVLMATNQVKAGFLYG